MPLTHWSRRWAGLREGLANGPVHCRRVAPADRVEKGLDGVGAGLPSDLIHDVLRRIHVAPVDCVEEGADVAVGGTAAVAGAAAVAGLPHDVADGLVRRAHVAVVDCVKEVADVLGAGLRLHHSIPDGLERACMAAAGPRRCLPHDSADGLVGPAHVALADSVEEVAGTVGGGLARRRGALRGVGRRWWMHMVPVTHDAVDGLVRGGHVALVDSVEQDIDEIGGGLAPVHGAPHDRRGLGGMRCLLLVAHDAVDGRVSGGHVAPVDGVEQGVDEIGGGLASRPSAPRGPGGV
mmetsp:Transcript_123569/g.384679  ORF Transcript_123569/g.384679 Transcript_123569/m.384679 type:complete len:292 (+) Transcript_123569:118-993(+)